MSKIGPYELDSIVVGDCLDVMARMPDGCVDLVVTSPPYWNLKDYAHWERYEDYVTDVCEWVTALARLVRLGGHILWNCQEKLPYPPSENGTDERLYLPLLSDTERCAYAAGLIPEAVIVWKKTNKNNQKMFGSYPFPPTIITDNSTERVAHWRSRGRVVVDRHVREASRITKSEWVNWATDLWTFSIAIANPHPAPFPEELPHRCIKLWSCVGEIVFDPFMGSGTTAVAAKKLGRHWFGCDTSEEYVKMARNRVAKINGIQLDLPLK